ncbi:MAG TPA: hypothetical protein VND87_19650 [Stellaceae bacterium]|nr:hypothetical protein [Stellaceae bacterium]
MWSLSHDEILRIKEELKGRRAALRARYDDEVKALEADIANIETLELAALLFMAKYKSEAVEDIALSELVAVQELDWDPAGPSVGPSAPNSWRAFLDPLNDPHLTVEPEPAAAADAKPAPRSRQPR